ncbi:MAG: hypothetical protein Q4A82_07240 [Corynebacterium sp.]|nr:hypothetical protein [Corynebacterium sp.]
MKNRDFRLFWISGVASQITGVAASFALPLVVYRQTGDLLAAGSLTSLIAIISLVWDFGWQPGGHVAQKTHHCYL